METGMSCVCNRIIAWLQTQACIILIVYFNQSSTLGVNSACHAAIFTAASAFAAAVKLASAVLTNTKEDGVTCLGAYMSLERCD